MAFAAKDGKKFSMASRRMAHDQSMSAKQDPENVLDAPSEDGMEPDGDEQDGSAVAAEHGPATEVNISHDHEMGTHHVHSVHQDGHEHHSDHASADEAHEHGKKLAGSESTRKRRRARR